MFDSTAETIAHDAKVLEVKGEGTEREFKIHFLGWKARYRRRALRGRGEVAPVTRRD